MPGITAQEPFGSRSDSGIGLADYPKDAKKRGEEPGDRAATVFSLRRFFRPRSVAVIGASRDPASIGHRLFEALIQSGFEGSVYPINPKA